MCEKFFEAFQHSFKVMYKLWCQINPLSYHSCLFYAEGFHSGHFIAKLSFKNLRAFLKQITGLVGDFWIFFGPHKYLVTLTILARYGAKY